MKDYLCRDLTQVINTDITSKKLKTINLSDFSSNNKQVLVASMRSSRKFEFEFEIRFDDEDRISSFDSSAPLVTNTDVDGSAIVDF